MFDNELRLEREYQGMEMSIKQFELYREDVRDLVALTVVKMDKYLIVNTLQVGFCVTLLTEGRPEPEPGEAAPEWLLFVEQTCIAGAFLYYVLSMWLSMHASIAAHSFGVRMLTQFVRLPVPTSKDMDDARGLAEDFESANIKDMLRIPVWKQQLRRFQQAMTDLHTDNQADTDVDEDASELPGQPGTLGESPVAMLEHVRLYRQLQANWQSYDAYARVCMAMGTFQFLQAMSYYSLAVLVAHGDGYWPGLACALVFMTTATISARLDIYLNKRLLEAFCALLYSPPVLTFFAMWFKDRFQGIWKEAWRLLIPIVFILHLTWMIFSITIARASDVGKVYLPKKFRSVLFLDVFGWQGQDASTYAASSSSPDDAASSPSAANPMGGARGGGLASVSERDDMANLPTGAQDVILGKCSRLRKELSQDLARWESDKVQYLLDDDPEGFQDEVQKMREVFNEVGNELDDLPGGDPISEFCASFPSSPLESDNVNVWLQLVYSSSDGRYTPFFYSCETGDICWEVPEEPVRICTVSSMVDKMTDYRSDCDSLADAARQREKKRLAVETESVAAEKDKAFAVGGGYYDTSQLGDAFVAAEVHHARMKGREHLRENAKPGKIPWRTVLIGSSVLVALWCFGTTWIICDAWLNIKFEVLQEEEDVMRDDLGMPELVFDGPWPHPFFKLEALACPPDASHALFLSERYGVHALELSKETLGLQPALEECLSRAPALQGRGLADITFDCPNSAEHGCTVVLLGIDGSSALRCSLTRSEAAPVSQRLALTGGHWRALVATGINSSLWALGNDGLTKFSFQNRSGALKELFPVADFQHPAATNLTSLGVFGDRFLLGLEDSGSLYAWPLQGGRHRKRRLYSREARWHSVCANPSGIYLAGRRLRDNSLGIWRVDLPDWMSGRESFARRVVLDPRRWMQSRGANDL